MIYDTCSEIVRWHSFKYALLEMCKQELRDLCSIICGMSSAKFDIINIIIIVICMSQKVPHLELNTQRFSKESLTNKQSSHSVITCKNSETNRYERYIPFQFRDKHISNKQSSHITHKESNPFNSLVNPCLSKQQEYFSTDNGPKFPLQNMFEYKKVMPKIAQKKPFLKQINAEIPKLRETNSTQSQSPKAKMPFFNTKLSNFKKLKLLGKGKFGDVYLVRHNKTGFITALKIINKTDLLMGSQEEKQKAVNQITREIKIQAFLNHPNLIKLYDFFSDQDNIYLVLELACDGHLFQFLEKNGKLSEETSSIVIREVVEGINFLHKHSIIHRDIKLQNIVLAHGMAKICDFGWSVYCPKEFRTTICGTPIYLSPQILTGKQYNKKIDIWAIGSLAHQLITGEDPFKIKTKEDLVRVVEQDFQMTSGSVELKSFLNFILRKNPSKRPDTDTIKRHPFLQKYKDFETSEELCKLIYNF